MSDYNKISGKTKLKNTRASIDSEYFLTYDIPNREAYTPDCQIGKTTLLSCRKEPMSTTVLVTSITSFLGFLINCLILFLVLSKGRKKYHYLFAAIPFILAFWDIGVFLTMIRNNFVNELPIYGYIISLPCVFLPALIYHFTCSYLNHPRKISTIIIWVYCAVGFILTVTGLGGKFDGIYHYSWGNLFRPDTQSLIGTASWIVVFYIFTWLSCWFLFRAYRRESSPILKRHILYIFISFLVISFANVKILALYNIDNPFLLPAGMLIIDIFGAVIGLSIIKHRLFDITIIVKKGTIYSILVALIIFIFSCSEHFLSKYLGDLLGDQPLYIHLISIALVVAILMPVRNVIERGISRYFSKRKVEF